LRDARSADSLYHFLHLPPPRSPLFPYTTLFRSRTRRTRTVQRLAHSSTTAPACTSPSSPTSPKAPRARSHRVSPTPPTLISALNPGIPNDLPPLRIMAPPAE